MYVKIEIKKKTSHQQIKSYDFSNQKDWIGNCINFYLKNVIWGVVLVKKQEYKRFDLPNKKQLLRDRT